MWKWKYKYALEIQCPKMLNKPLNINQGRQIDGTVAEVSCILYNPVVSFSSL